jgi:hypothetical protein
MNQLELDLDADSSVINLMAQVESHRILAGSYSLAANEILAKARALCLHQNTETKSEYFSGGYDYTSRTEYVERCSLCGTVIRTWDKDHGHYG